MKKLVLLTASFLAISFLAGCDGNSIVEHSHSHSSEHSSSQSTSSETSSDEPSSSGHSHEHSSSGSDSSGTQPHTHTYIHYDAEPATCTAIGHIEHYYCEGCHTFFNTSFQEIDHDDLHIDALGHSYGSPTYYWAADLSKVVATVVCSRDNTHILTETVDTTSAITKDATCGEEGVKTYTAIFTNSRFVTQTRTEPIAKTSHRYGTPTYNWAADYSKVVATAVCLNNGTHLVSEEAIPTSSITTPATCDEDGVRTYVVTFNNSLFSQQTREVAIPATDHNYGTPTFEWADDFSKVTATAICSDDPAHVLKEEVVPTSSITTPATCDKDGVRTYVAAFTNQLFGVQTKTAPVEKTNHDWNAPTYSWTADYSSCTAQRVCKNNPSHIEKETVTTGEGITSKVSKAATCSQKGETTFTAVFTNAALGKSDKVVRNIPANPSLHVWSNVSYTWNNTNTELTAERECLVCKTKQSETVSASLTNSVKATCVNGEIKTYTSNPFINEAFKAQIKVVDDGVVLESGHDWNEPTYVWSNDNSQVTATRTCKNNPEHKQTETVNTNYVDNPKATCETAGTRTFTVAFTNPVFSVAPKNVELPATGHEYVYSGFKWTGNQAKAVYVCSHEGCEHKTVEYDAAVEASIKTPATCVSEGTTSYVASYDNHVSEANPIVDIPVDDSAHKWGEITYTWTEEAGKLYCTAQRVCENDPDHKQTEKKLATLVNEKLATCNATGYRNYIAQFDNPLFADQTKHYDLAIDDNAHNYELKEFIWNNSEHTAEYKLVCSICGDEDIHPATVVFDKEISPATCTTKQVVSYKASYLTNTEIKEFAIGGEPAGHTWGEPTYVWSSDNSQVTATRTCTVCGEKETEIVVTTSTVTLEPTVDAIGNRRYTAEGFKNAAFVKQTKDVDIPKLDHVHMYSDKTVNPTCTEKGYVVYTCSCGDSYIDQDSYTDALGHEFGLVTYVWSNDNGEVTASRTCSLCDAKETETVATTNKVEKAASCAETGLLRYTSKAFENAAFKAQTKDIVLEKLPHEYEFKNFSWSNEYANADAVLECQNCDATTKVAATVTTRTVAATYDAAGSKTFTAFYENHTETKTVTLPQLTRTWSNWTVTVDPTCTTKGVETRTSNDEKVENRDVAALGHDYQLKTTVPATCQAAGYKEYECSRCHDTYKDTLPQLEHVWNQELTCEQGHTCTICGETEPALGHSYPNTPKESHDADCEHPAYQIFICERCGEEHKVESGSALGHNYIGKTVLQAGHESCYYNYINECSRCNKTEIVNSYENHTYKSTVTLEATCSAIGTKLSVCEHCGKVVEEYIPIDKVNGHSWVDGAYDAETHKLTQECEICHETRTITAYRDVVKAEDVKAEANEQISLKEGSVSLDQGVLDTVESTGTSEDKLSLEINKNSISEAEEKGVTLTEEQKQQIGEGSIYDFTMKKGEETISNFGADNYITITLPYELKEGVDVDSIAVWYINDSNELESVQATYANGYVTFQTNHFSYYTITNLTPEQKCELYGHNFEVTHVLGDCVSDTYDYYECNVCGEHYEVLIQAATGHDWKEVSRVEATCGVRGSVTYKCENCQETRVERDSTVQRHQYEFVEYVAPTCEDAGYSKEVCIHCGNVIEKVLPALGHNYETVRVEATHTEDGSISLVCKLCDDTRVLSVIPATGHNFTEWTVKTPATCNSEGLEERHCEEHPEVSETRIIAMKDHNPGQVVKENNVPGTCDVAGSYDEVIYCQDCGLELSREHKVNPALSHEYGEWVIDEVATCTALGHRHQTCINCGNVIEESIAKLPHEIKEGYESNKYYHWQVCENCETVLNKKAHSASEKVIENFVESDYEHDGGYDEVYYCSVCEHEISRSHVTTPKLSITVTNAEIFFDEYNVAYVIVNYSNDTSERINDISVTAVISEHGCEEAYTITYKASYKVNDSFDLSKEKVVDMPATGHDLAEGFVSDGESHWQVCHNCEEKVNVTAHVEGSLVIENEVSSTCTVKGSHDEVVYCAVCDHELSRKSVELELLPHIPAPAKEENRVEATCEEDGSYDLVSYCTICGEKVEEQHNVIPALGHALTHVDGVEPSCQHEGNIEYWHCSECDRLFADELGTKEVDGSVILPKSEHTLDHHEATVPTCTESGNVEYWQCSICNKYFADNEGKKQITLASTVLEAYGHTLTHSEAVEATCLNEGNIEYWYCPVCNKYFANKDALVEIQHSDIVVDQLPHELTHTEAVEPTCTEGGNIEYWYCSECNRYFADSEGKNAITGNLLLPAKGHVMQHFDRVSPTCTENGNVEYYYCTVCEQYFADRNGYHQVTLEDVVLPKTGHSLKYVAEKEATCFEEGNVEYYYCQVCKHYFLDANGEQEVTLEEVTIAKLEHSLIHHEGVSPTCTSEGNIEYWQCEHCQTYFSNEGNTVVSKKDLVINKLPHTLTHFEEAEPTCEEEGNIEYWYCSECKQYFADKDGKTVISVEETTVPALGHNLTEIETVPSTCTTQGHVEYGVCSNCEKYFVFEQGQLVEKEYEELLLPLLDHAPGKAERVDEVPSTCTVAGHYYEVVKCSECGEVLSRELKELPLLDHVLSEKYSYDKEAHWHTCVNCEAVVDRMAHNAGEAVIENVVPSTCVEKGSHDEVVYCTVCGYELSRTHVELELLDHTPGQAERVDEVPSTCTVAGHYYEVVKCSECGEVLSRELKELPLAEHTISEAYRYDEESHWRVCTVCGEKLEEAEHDYQNGKCVVCGRVDSSYVPTYTATFTFADDNNSASYVIYADGEVIKEGTEKTTVTRTEYPCDKVNTETYKVVAVYDGKEFSDTKVIEIPAREHTYKEEYAYNDNGHYQVCEVCGSVSTLEEHVFGENNVCSVCGYQKASTQCDHTVFHDERFDLGDYGGCSGTYAIIQSCECGEVHKYDVTSMGPNGVACKYGETAQTKYVYNGVEYNAMIATCSVCHFSQVSLAGAQEKVSDCLTVTHAYGLYLNPEGEIVFVIQIDYPNYTHSPENTRIVLDECGTYADVTVCKNCGEITSINKMEFSCKEMTDEDTVEEKIDEQTTSYTNRRTCNTTGVQFISVRVVTNSGCDTKVVSTSTVLDKDNKELLKYSQTSYSSDHKYVEEYTLLDEALGCEGGVSITYTCSVCGYSYYGFTKSHNYQHNSYEIDSDSGDYVFRFDYQECKYCHTVRNVEQRINGKLVKPVEQSVTTVVDGVTYEGIEYTLADYNLVFTYYVYAEDISECETDYHLIYNVTKDGKTEVDIKDYVMVNANHGESTVQSISYYDPEYGCERGGEATLLCSVCGETYTETFYNHQYVDGKCKYCGKLENCSHKNSTKATVNMTDLGYCEGNADYTYYHCDTCGINYFLETPEEPVCEFDYENYKQDKVNYNGKAYEARVVTCKKCGKQYASFETGMTQEGCYISGSYVLVLYDLDNNPLYIEMNYSYEQHSSSELTSITLSPCGASIYTSICERCGKTTYVNMESLSFGECQIDFVNAESESGMTMDGTCSVCHTDFHIEQKDVATSACEGVRSVIILVKDAKGNEVFNYINEAPYASHKYNYEYQFNNGYNCEDGLKANGTCSVCGKNDSFQTYGHNYDYNGVSLDKYGGEGKLSYGECRYCHEKSIMDFCLPKEMYQVSSKEQVGEDGVKHNITTYEYLKEDSSFSLVIDSYSVKEDCLEKNYSTYSFQGKDDSLEITFYSTKASHNLDYDNMIIDVLDKDCDKGVRITMTCKDCEQTITQTIYGHKYTHETINIAEKYEDACGGYIYLERCTFCGKENHKYELNDHIFVETPSVEEIDGVKYQVVTSECGNCDLSLVVKYYDEFRDEYHYTRHVIEDIYYGEVNLYHNESSLEKSLPNPYEIGVIRIAAPSQYLNAYKDYFYSFRDSHPEYTYLEFEFIDMNESEAYSRVIGDNEMIDLAIVSSDGVNNLVNLKYLHSLDNEELLDYIENNYSDILINRAKDGEELYGIPVAFDNTYFLYYDKSVLSAEDVISFETIVNKAKAANKTVGFEYTSGWYNAAFFYGAGAQSEWTFDKDGYPIAVNDTYNTSAGQNAYIGLQNILSSGVVVNSYNFEKGCVAVISGSWIKNQVQEILGDNMGVAVLPTFTVDEQTYSLSPLSSGNYMVITNHNNEYRSALLERFMLELNDQNNLLRLYKMSGRIPANLTVQNNEDIISDPVNAVVLDQINVNSHVQGLYPGDWWSASRQLGINAEEGVSPVEALENYENAIRDLIYIPHEHDFSLIETNYYNGVDCADGGQYVYKCNQCNEHRYEDFYGHNTTTSHEEFTDNNELLVELFIETCSRCGKMMKSNYNVVKEATTSEYTLTHEGKAFVGKKYAFENSSYFFFEGSYVEQEFPCYGTRYALTYFGDGEENIQYAYIASENFTSHGDIRIYYEGDECGSYMNENTICLACGETLNSRFIEEHVYDENSLCKYCGKSSNPQSETYHRESGNELYRTHLSNYSKYMDEAKAVNDNDDLRYIKFAKAEAELLSKAIVLPTTTAGGLYIMSRVAPHTVSAALTGSDADKLKHLVLVNYDKNLLFITKEHYNELMDLYEQAVNGQGEYDPAAYLVSKGYTISNNYTTNYSADLKTLDIHSTNSSSDISILANLVEGLLEYDELGNLVPLLAKALPTVSNDGLTYTFEIREDAYWYNRDGSIYGQVTADDFVAGFQHMLDAQAGLDYLVDGVIVGVSEYLYEGASFDNVGVKAVDNKLVITLVNRESFFLSRLTYSCFTPLNRTFYLSKGGTFGIDEYLNARASEAYQYGNVNDLDSILYNSAFLLTSNERSQAITLVKNANYHSADEVTLESITYLYNDNYTPEQYYNMVLAGQFVGINLNSSTSTLNMAKEQGLFDRYAHLSQTTAVTYFATLNLDRAAWNYDNDFYSTQDAVQAETNHLVMQNNNFRLALLSAWNRADYNAVSRGDGNLGLRNLITAPQFVHLSNDVTYEGKEFAKGTSYGELVESFLLRDYGIEVDLSDGQDGWFNPTNAKNYLALAKQELGENWGKVVIDLVVLETYPSIMNQAYSFKKSLESVLGSENVEVRFIATSSISDYYELNHYVRDVANMNFDFNTSSGWGPDYIDPSSYLDIFLSNGYVTPFTGLSGDEYKVSIEQKHYHKYIDESYELLGSDCFDKGYLVHKRCEECGFETTTRQFGHIYNNQHIELEKYGLLNSYIDESGCKICGADSNAYINIDPQYLTNFTSGTRTDEDGNTYGYELYVNEEYQLEYEIEHHNDLVDVGNCLYRETTIFKLTIGEYAYTNQSSYFVEKHHTVETGNFDLEGHASCSEGITVEVYCDKCEKTFNIGTYEHAYNEDMVCTRCGYVDKGEGDCNHEITYSKDIVVDAPTCNQEGKGAKQELCEKCGKVISEENYSIPKVDHVVGYTETKEVLGEDGSVTTYVYEYCAYCKELIKSYEAA